jgi:hypothetical protein
VHLARELFAALVVRFVDGIYELNVMSRLSASASPGMSCLSIWLLTKTGHLFFESAVQWLEQTHTQSLMSSLRFFASPV